MRSSDFERQPYFAPTELKVVFVFIFYQYSAPTELLSAAYLLSLSFLSYMQTCLRHNSTTEVYSTQPYKCEAFTKSGGRKKRRAWVSPER